MIVIKKKNYWWNLILDVDNIPWFDLVLEFKLLVEKQTFSFLDRAIAV